MKINTIGLWTSAEDQKMLKMIAAGSDGQFISVEAKIENQ